MGLQAQLCSMLRPPNLPFNCRPLQALSKVHGFISFAFQPDLLSRFINFVMWILMTGGMTGGAVAQAPRGEGQGRAGCACL